MSEATVPLAMSTHAYIRRETLASMAINAAMSLAFFIGVFRAIDPVPLWGLGNWVFDFAPQSFMIAVMSTLVPGAIAGRKLRSGAVVPLATPSRLPRRLIPRAVLLGIASALCGTCAVAALAWLADIESVGALAAGGLKVAYGALLALLVTPPSLRAALARPIAARS